MALLRMFPARAPNVRFSRTDDVPYVGRSSGQDAAGGEGISREGRRTSRRSVGALMRTASAAFLLKRLLIVMFCDNAGHRWSGNSIQQIGYLQSWTACVSFAG